MHGKPQLKQCSGLTISTRLAVVAVCVGRLIMTVPGAAAAG